MLACAPSVYVAVFKEAMNAHLASSHFHGPLRTSMLFVTLRAVPRLANNSDNDGVAWWIPLPDSYP
jgi:hypothetical protein